MVFGLVRVFSIGIVIFSSKVWFGMSIGGVNVLWLGSFVVFELVMFEFVELCPL